MRDEVLPKNILMIGPTGCGKTEISRRLAKLANAPFLKVEATKFTEVGYVGRDVEQIVRDLLEIGIALVKERKRKDIEAKAQLAAEDRILDRAGRRQRLGDHARCLPPQAARRRTRRQGGRNRGDGSGAGAADDGVAQHAGCLDRRDQPRRHLRQGHGRPHQDAPDDSCRGACAACSIEESEKLLDAEQVTQEAIHDVENNGIVFLDEIDKICAREGRGGADVSREGVQRDLLPLIEGTSVATKHGTVKTDHILFIASGAFHVSKPSDLLPELQGRLPIRVELNPLTEDDFRRILTETEACITKQYVALMRTEGVDLAFASGRDR